MNLQPLRGLVRAPLLIAASPALVLAAAPTDPEPPIEPDLQLAGDTYTRVERRANSFTSSNQDAVTLAQDAAGNTVVVWQSRRQQEGTYGIYAQRFDAEGAPVGDEVRVNSTTRSMQMQPAVAVDPDGTAWFAWRSFGQDGDQGAIVARRFDAELSTATHEVIVNTEARGHQSDPVIAAFADGTALVTWTTTRPDGGSEIHARRLSASGEPAAAVLRVDQVGGVGNRLPAVATDADGRAVVVWARVDANGVPDGIFARRLDREGMFLGSEIRVDTAGKVHAIEPQLAAAPDGAFVVAWLESETNDYGIRLRRFELSEDATELTGSPVRTVPVSGPGYTSGHSVDVDSAGNCLVSWSRFGDGEKREPGLFARVYDAKGEPRTSIFRVTGQSEGPQRQSPDRGVARTVLGDDGRLLFVWSGDAGLGDASGAHLTLLLPEGFAPAGKTAAAEDVRFAPLAGASKDSEGATPHDPPTFDPELVDHSRVDDFPTLAPGVSGDIDFLGITNTGWVPPDPHMAAGPDHVVLMTNGAIAFFDKSGTLLFQDQIEGGSGFWGNLGATNFVFDPEVIWDPHSNRFMAMAVERASDGDPYYLLAISDDADPQGAWHKYRINVLTSAGDTDIDSPQIAVDEDVIYLTSDFFGPDKFHIYMIEKAPVLSGGPINFTDLVHQGSQSWGCPVHYDTTAPAQYHIEALIGQTTPTIRFRAVTDPLTSPALSTVSIALPVSYSHPEDVPSMGTSNRIETFEARFWSAVYRDGFLWATHHTGSGKVKQRWYQFAMNDWPNGPTPTLVQHGTVNLGGDIRSFFGSIWVDENGNAGLTYARSAPDEFISMERTYRTPSDPPGEMRTPVSVRVSTSAEQGNRWGDYSAVTDDPSTPGVFWAHHEYRNNSGWRTRVARFEVCGPVTNYCSTAPNSVGAGALISHAGTTSITANDFTLVAQDCPVGKFGLFYYGPNEISVPFGDGIRCVGGLTQRLNPTILTDGAGMAMRTLDYGALPANGQITSGSTWKFQFWYRDPDGPGGEGFNLTDALSAPFCP